MLQRHADRGEGRKGRGAAQGIRLRGMFHVFQMSMDLFPESREAWAEAGKFCRSSTTSA